MCRHVRVRCMTKKKGEEILTRRAFFRNAGKAILPIISTVVLSGISGIAKAADKMAMGCDVCSATCAGTCKGTCSFTCVDTCSGRCAQYCQVECAGLCDRECAFACDGKCKGACKGTCEGECQNSCSISCTSGNK